MEPQSRLGISISAFVCVPGRSCECACRGQFGQHQHRRPCVAVCTAADRSKAEGRVARQSPGIYSPAPSESAEREPGGKCGINLTHVTYCS